MYVTCGERQALIVKRSKTLPINGSDMGSNPVESTIEDVLTEYSGESPSGSVCWCRQSSKSRLLIHLLQMQIFDIIQYSPVAQLVEQWTVNPWVIGSRPVGGAMSLTKDSRKPQ